MFQLCLVHIVLVLAHPNALGVDLNQLGQWVHEPPSYRNSTPHGHILVGKFLTGNRRRRVDRRTILAHYIGRNVLDLSQDVGRFAPGGAITHSDGLGIVMPSYGRKLIKSVTFGLIANGKHDRVIKQIALRIEANHLTSRANTGIYPHHSLLSERCGQKKLAQVFGKYPDSLLVSGFLSGVGKLRFDRRLYQSFVAIVDRFAHKSPARAHAMHITALDTVGTFLLFHVDTYPQYALALPTAHGQ